MLDVIVTIEACHLDMSVIVVIEASHSLVGDVITTHALLVL